MLFFRNQMVCCLVLFDLWFCWLQQSRNYVSTVWYSHVSFLKIYYTISCFIFVYRAGGILFRSSSSVCMSFVYLQFRLISHLYFCHVFADVGGAGVVFQGDNQHRIHRVPHARPTMVQIAVLVVPYHQQLFLLRGEPRCRLLWCHIL